MGVWVGLEPLKPSTCNQRRPSDARRQGEGSCWSPARAAAATATGLGASSRTSCIPRMIILLRF